MSSGFQGRGNNPLGGGRECAACHRLNNYGPSPYCDECRYLDSVGFQPFTCTHYYKPSVAAVSDPRERLAALENGDFSASQSRPIESHEDASQPRRQNKHDILISHGDERESNGVHGYPSMPSSNCIVGRRLETPFFIGQNLDHTSPGQQHTHGYTPNTARHSLATDLYSQTPSSWPAFGAEEADLMRHFINNLSPLLDACDHARHFAFVVPQYAASSLALQYAIFAASARHLSFPYPYCRSIAARYYHLCQSALMLMAQDSEDIPVEIPMAVTVILRLFDELEAASLKKLERPCLPVGLQILIDGHIDTLPMSTLRRATFLIAARQEILDAFVAHRAPVESICYPESSLDPTDDHDTWAIRMIFHCSSVLHFTYPYGNTPREDRVARWSYLAKYTQGWLAARPSFFKPIYRNHFPGKAFPTMVFHTRAHAIADLHYHMSAILLAISNPILSEVSLPPSSRASMLQERDNKIRHNVDMVCAHAICQENFAMATIIASAVVVDCGKFYHTRREQEALLIVLRLAEIEHGWPTAEAQRSLREIWRWDGERSRG